MKNNYLHRINWVDGMKVNKDTFIALEDSIIQNTQLSYGNTLTPINYGFLPEYSNTQDKSLMSISMDGQRTLVIHIHYCNAVTLGGHRIFINDEITQLMEQSGQVAQHKYKITSKESALYVLLSINPYKRIPIGEIDPNEEPERPPHVIPEYRISVVSEEEFLSPNIKMQHVPIGMITWNNGEATLNEDFIPPCTSVQSHQDLVYSYTQVGAFFNKIESYAIQIIQKILQKKQTNDIAEMVKTMCVDTLAYLKLAIPEYRTKDKYAAPVEIFTKLICLARVIKGSLDIYLGTGREELINYYTEWSFGTQGAFENTLNEMIDFEYVHHDINGALDQAVVFINSMIALYKKLNELDYIGKKEDSQIFVKEEVVLEESNKNRNRFIID